MRSSLIVLALVAGAVADGCARRERDAKTAAVPAPAPRRAFYYWRTTFRLTETEARAMTALAIERLYVRFFDLDVDANASAGASAAPRPRAPLVARAEDIPSAIEIVPVVFIRERALRRLDLAGTRGLSDLIFNELEARAARLGKKLVEVQLDCDWTETTRAAFFGLLERLRERGRQRAVTITATIRLHQLKYRERTGVPPVERAMLMFYNMGSVDADPNARAIFDPARARAYLGRVSDYPLPLDVALPIWSWVVHVRDGRVEGLLEDRDRRTLEDKPWLRAAGENRFVVTEQSFLNGVLLRAGDFLDLEETTRDTTRSAAAMIAERLAPVPQRRTIALFHLSESNLARHATPDLARVFALF